MSRCMTRLAELIAPCGPIFDAKAAERLRETLTQAAEGRPWAKAFEAAWPALEPVFGASPYLAGLARRAPERLGELLESDPDLRLKDVLARTAAAGDLPYDQAKAALRALKAEAHLLTALADLGGVWSLDAVTGALTRFADASLASAL